MDEAFIMNAFRLLGQKPINARVIYDKYTNLPAGFCFVEFASDGEAKLALGSLNGKIIPDSKPPKKFKLNFANQQPSSVGQAPIPQTPKPVGDFAVLVTDLSPDVDDFTLYRAFVSR